MSNLLIQYIDSNRYSDWNTFVDQSPQGDVFCYSWWLDAITKSNFRILVCLEKDEIVAGMPLACDSNNYVNEPPLTRTLGVLYKPKDTLNDHNYTSNQRRWLNALIEYLPHESFVQVCMHHNFTDWLPFRWKGYKQTTRYTYIIDYNGKTEDDLRNNLNRGRKNIINRAKKNGIKVEETNDIALLYHYECLSYERQGLKFRIPFEVLKNLDEAILKHGKRIIFKAFDDSDKVLAVIYLAYNRKSVYYLLSGSDPEFRNTGAHSLVLWESVKFFRNKVDYFNFGGSDIKQIEEHVKGFGGIMTPYFHIFNEELLFEKNGLHYHTVQILFHLKKLSWGVILRVFKGK